MVVDVIDCGPIKYVGLSARKCREVTIIDTGLQPAMLTLWEDFAEIDGSKIDARLAGLDTSETTQPEVATAEPEYPIILAKRVAHSTYAGSSFSTRYSSVILMDSPYRQVQELQNWVKANRTLLESYNHGGSSQRTAPTFLTSPKTAAAVANPLPQYNVVPIAAIHPDSTTQVFMIEGEIAIPANQNFLTLVCPNCSHQYRPSSSKITECWECNTVLEFKPKLNFDVDVTDATGKIKGIFSGQLADDLLRMSAEEIYDTMVIRKQQLPLQRVNERLHHKVFRMQLKKPYLKSNEMRGYINSCVEQPQEQSMGTISNTNVAEPPSNNIKQESGSVYCTDTDTSSVAAITESPVQEIRHQLGSPKRHRSEIEDHPKKK